MAGLLETEASASRSGDLGCNSDSGTVTDAVSPCLSVSGSRLERMPKAEATELAPKKSAEALRYPTVAKGFLAWVFQSPHFFGEASERRPWAYKREDSRAAFARLSL